MKIGIAIQALRKSLGEIGGEAAFLQNPSYEQFLLLSTVDGIPLADFLHAEYSRTFPDQPPSFDFLAVYNLFFQATVTPDIHEKRLAAIARLQVQIALQRQYLR